MKYSFRIVVFMYFIFGYSVFAENTKINGIAESFKGEIVKLTAYSDPLSKSLIELSRDTIDEKGVFFLSANFKDIRYARIKIKNIYFSIYLEPNTNYEVKIPSLNEILDGEPIDRLKAFMPIELYADFVRLDTNSLNYKIGAFNELYNNFIIEHQKELINTRNKKLVLSFKKLVEEKFNKISNSFLQNYIFYRIASFEMLEQMHNNADANKLFFNNKPILYHNDEYIDFFSNFYGKYLLKLSKGIDRDSIIYAINNEKSYSSLVKILANDSILLMNDTLREFVLMNGLREIFPYPEFKKEGIIDILQFISDKGNVEIHREIAASIINELLYLLPGTKAPEFTVFSLNDQLSSLSQRRGKLVYINFFTSWNLYSIEEIKSLDSLKKVFSEKVDFFNISIDEDVDILKSCITDYRLKGDFYHLGINKDIIELYRIVTVPYSVLIDENGVIIACPALKPSENFFGYIESFFHKRELENQRKLDEFKRNQLKGRVYEINNKSR